MNYYEELGVSQQATEQEIRKAHRRLVKLMHPDAQPDQSLKIMAETQMRRLNSIVSTLLDADQRGLYDDQLLAAQTPVRQGSILESWKGIPWWLASATGAVVLTLVAVWLWADHLGTTFGNKSGKTVYVAAAESHQVETPHPVQPESSNRVGASYKHPSETPTGGGITTLVVPDAPRDAKPIMKQEAPPVPVATQTAAPPPKVAQAPVVQQAPKATPNNVQPKVVANTTNQTKTAALKPVNVPPPVDAPQTKPHKMFTLPAGSLIARATTPNSNTGQLPAPPGVAPQAGGRDLSGSSSIPTSPLPSATPPKPAVVTTTAADSGGNVPVSSSGDPLEGEWVYAPKEPERRRAGFYPPEFIDLKLFGAGDPGNLKGQYSAKYVVTDRPVSPEISFELASVAKGSRKFVWQSSNGAKGTLSIDPIDDQTIRIDWHTTSAIRGPALTSGQATLVRRQ